jgi:hypothetical protein
MNRLSSFREIRNAKLVAVALVALLISLFPVTAGAQAGGPRVTIPDTVPKPVRGGQMNGRGQYNQNEVMHLVIGLRPPNLAEEEQFLRDLQTKNSPLYHQFLTPSQWNARFAPSAQDEQAVVDWAQSQGLTVTERFPNRLTVGVRGPVSAVARALGVQINAYEKDGAIYHSNDRDPAVPASLAGIVHSIAGLNNVGALQSDVRISKPASNSRGGNPNENTTHAIQANGDGTKRPSASASPGGNTAAPSPNLMSGKIEVSDLFTSNGYSVSALYNLGHCCNPFHSPANGAPATTSIAIITACDVDISQNGDLVTFANQYGLALNTSLIDVNGGPANDNNCKNTNGGLNSDGLETTLDVEVANAMANSFGCYCDTAQVFVYRAPSGTPNNGNPTFNFSDNITAWQQAVNDNFARSGSESWGCTEPNETNSCWDSGDANSMHNIFNQALGQGWTISIAAGDNGAFDDKSTLSVQYPAVDPDVVAAGGTVLSLDSSGNYVSEVAWNGGAGGCSAFYSAPFYQTTYTTGNGATQTFTNPCGGSSRSIPDISLNAGGSQAEFFNGGWIGVRGTSIVAPELAGLFANENAYLLSMGSICGGSGNGPCAPLGQPHQWIYFEGSEPGIFAPHNPYYDITSGSNNGPFGSGGFSAVSGFDRATGWGTFDALQFAWMFNWQFVFTDNHGPIVTYGGSPAPGWYNTDQSITFSVSDPVQGQDLAASGVAGFTARWDADPGNPFSETTPGCSGAYCNVFWNGPQTIATSGHLGLAAQGEGCHTTHVRGWDNQGQNSGDQTAGSYCYDIHPPVIHCSASDGLWHGTDVSLGCTASDSLSGLAQPSDASFSLSTSVPAGTETSNALTGSHQVCDVATNCLTAGPIGGNMVDKKPPSITITTPPLGSPYLLNQTVASSYACADGGSGVKTCVGTVPNGSNIDTASVGTKSFSVNATDNVGNASSSSVNYGVTYKICLTYNPAKPVNSGATNPFTLQLCDANGVNVSSNAITLTAIGVTPSEPLVSPSNPTNVFRFDPVVKQYIYNLRTTGYPSGSYNLNFTVSGDPVVHTAPFVVK